MTSINTARFNELTSIDSLSAQQLTSVRRLRRFAESQGVSPYTVGILCQRDTALLGKLTDGKRYAKLSPASRELLIAEVRELVHPWEPAVVAVWSHWCEANNVSVSPVKDWINEAHAEMVAYSEQKLAEAAEPSRSLAEIALAYGYGPASIARWAEMETNRDGHPFGKRLPDRESDEGIELADEVFRACMPHSPEAEVTRLRRRRA